MANTYNYKKIIENEFREIFVQGLHPNCQISQEKIPLIWGGEFEYDAVVRKNGKLVAVYCLSCSEYRTEGGKAGTGKYRKIQSDILMMLGTECEKKVLVFTGPTMKSQVDKQKEVGRLPPEIETLSYKLSSKLSSLVQSVSADCVREVTPIRE